MFRGKTWFGGMSKPKNPHSLEQLKYLCQVLFKNQQVNDQNKGLLVENLRSIAEILIWGDQNDSTVFDFFLEKNMLSFFLKIMRQKCGSYVCVQLLQTLNILFENIRNETSLYYLLSNNHVNSIIVHKFDFSDEEVMAYYISFLKTLSLKLNTHTIHFFYNEHTNDFPLYTEAIKFFNHNESMVRIAVRTLTLNVFRVDDRAMLKFIRDRTAAPYFSNLVWFIGKHVLELDTSIQISHMQIQPMLADLVAEHLDHLHYLNDILCLRIDTLNDVLTDHLLNRLLIPLYVYSLVQQKPLSLDKDEKPHVSSILSLFLLSQVFLIISHQPLVQQLAHIILNRNMSLFCNGNKGSSGSLGGEAGSEPEFVAPEETLEQSLETTITYSISSDSLVHESNEKLHMSPILENEVDKTPQCSTLVQQNLENIVLDGELPDVSNDSAALEIANITDEEKAVAAKKYLHFDSIQETFTLSERPFLEAVFSALDCTENDHAALFSLCLLYALGHNPGINQDLLDTVLMPSDKSETKLYYNVNLVERMLKIIGLSCQYNSKVRLSTLQMTVLLLKQLVVKDGLSYLQDRHLAAIEQHREESSLLLRNFYKTEIFLDMFEDEYEEMKKKVLNVEYLMMDAKLLLPPTGTPMSGIEFHKRLPCGEVERARRAIRVFFLLRDLSLTLQREMETQLPLMTTQIKVNDVLDLNNGDLFYCTVVLRDGQKMKRFMVVDAFQLVLVESEPKRPGWGVARFVGYLQDVEVTGDKDDSQCLNITVHRPSSKASIVGRSPLLAAKFIFDDNIRCLAAKQSVTRGRQKARQRKLHQIAKLLDLPDHVQPCPSPGRRGHPNGEPGKASAMHRSMSQDTGFRGHLSLLSNASRGGLYGHHTPFFASAKPPGIARNLRQEERKVSETRGKPIPRAEKKRVSSSPIHSRRNSPKSRDSSPKQNDNLEEIPLEDLSRSRNSSRHNSPNIRKKSTSGLPQARISAPPGICHSHYSSSTSKQPTDFMNQRLLENVKVSKKALHQTSVVSLISESESTKESNLPIVAPVILAPTTENSQQSCLTDIAPCSLNSNGSTLCKKPDCVTENLNNLSESESSNQIQNGCVVGESVDSIPVISNSSCAAAQTITPENNIANAPSKTKGAIQTI